MYSAASGVTTSSTPTDSGLNRRVVNVQDRRLGQCSGMTPDEALAARGDAVLKLAFVFSLVVVPL
jgi:hypothetical protein